MCGLYFVLWLLVCYCDCVIVEVVCVYGIGLFLLLGFVIDVVCVGNGFVFGFGNMLVDVFELMLWMVLVIVEWVGVGYV